jgi:hypothetical protein
MFDSSASSMDEVKRLIREGNTDAAEEIASIQFGLSQEAAHNTVEQTVVNMKYSGHETLPVEPAPVSSMPPEPASSMPQPEVVNSPSHLYDEPQKPSNSRKWIIAGSIGAVVFLCMCCCIPVLILIITSIKNNQ